MMSQHRPSILLLLAATLAACLTDATAPAAAEVPAIIARQRHEKKVFTDAEIVEGFLKTAFGAEFHLAGRVDRIRKYDRAVRVFADGNRADRKAQLAKVVADIRGKVQHLDIAMSDTHDAANVVVKLVRDRELYRTIATFYGQERAKEIRSSLDPQCLSGFRKNENYEIEHSEKAQLPRTLMEAAGRLKASTAAREAPTAAPRLSAKFSTGLKSPPVPRPPETTIAASVSSGRPVAFFGSEEVIFAALAASETCGESSS